MSTYRYLFGTMYSYQDLWSACKDANLGKIQEILDSGIGNKIIVAEHLAEAGHIEIIKQMIEEGDANYGSILIGAVMGGHEDIIELLAGKPITKSALDVALMEAASEGNMKFSLLMLDKGADTYNSAMAQAASNGHMEIVTLMLNKGAKAYNWAMLLAAEGDQYEMVQFFLEKGADNHDESIQISATEEIKDLIETYKQGKNKLY